MGLSIEGAQDWPRSKAINDAVIVQYAIVYSSGESLKAELWNGDEKAADARAVWHQQQGRRAWFVVLEGDGYGYGMERQ
jgi:hypothetical protein